MRGLTALVTGGSSGIGLASARMLAQQGARVVLVGRQLARLNDAAASLDCDPDQVHCITGDVSSEGYANKVIFDTRKKFGAVDILINSAGAFRGGSILKMSEEDFDYMVDVNLKATWFMCKFAARAMIENGGGAIVNVASLAAQHPGNILASTYIASKGGVLALTRALAMELAPQIRVNCVVPGAVRSPMYDLMTRFSDSDEVFESGLSFFDLPEQEFAASIQAAESSRSKSASITATGEPEPDLADVSQVAEAVVALCDPRSAWVTGEQIVVGGSEHNI